HATSSTSATTTISDAAAGTTTASSSGLTAICVSGTTRVFAVPGHHRGNRRTMSAVYDAANARARAIDTPGARRTFTNRVRISGSVSWSVADDWSWLIMRIGANSAGAMPGREP